MALGGKRKGAGRKTGYRAPHTIETTKMREYFVKRVAEEFEPLMNTQLELAKGIHEAVLDKDGKVVNAYKKMPDPTTLKYLMDQSIGRAKETIDVTTNEKPADPVTQEKNNAILIGFIRKAK